MDGELNENVLAKTFVETATGSVSLLDLQELWNTNAAPLTTALFKAMTDAEAKAKIRSELDWAFSEDAADGSRQPMLWTEKVFIGDQKFGDSAIVSEAAKGHAEKLFRVEYIIEDDGISFAPRDEWQKVARSWALGEGSEALGEADYQEDEDEDHAVEEQEDVVIEFMESLEREGVIREVGIGSERVGRVVDLDEAAMAWDGKGPLKLRAVLIEPGPGNRRDKRFYPADMLKRDASVFEGGKMYATDHKPDQKTVLTEVADILRCPVGFSAKGGPIAEIGIFNPTFAQATYNRWKLGTLSNLAISIIGSGKVRKGKIGEEAFDIVTEISKGSADFVTNAGAGGHAQALAESGDSSDAEDRSIMEAEQVKAYLNAKKGVPKAILERMAERSFESEGAIEEAIKAEVAYIAGVSKAGNVVGLGEDGLEDDEQKSHGMRSLEEHQAAMDQLDQILGL